MLKVKLRSGDIRRISNDEAVETVLSAPYVRWYDAMPGGNPDRLEVLDLAFPAFLDAVPRFKTVLQGTGWKRLSESLAAASDLLQQIPADVPLSEWLTDGSQVSLLKDLFVATTGGGNGSIKDFGPAKATKMLHKKRPLLIPILDSWQFDAWNETHWSTEAMVGITVSLKRHLENQLNDFEELARSLGQADDSLPELSAIRLYDILFWEKSR